MMKYMLSLALLGSSAVFASEGLSNLTGASKAPKPFFSKENLNSFVNLPGKIGIDVLLTEATTECLNKRYGSQLSRFTANAVNATDIVQVSRTVIHAASNGYSTQPKVLVDIALRTLAREKALQGATKAVDYGLKKANLPTTEELQKKNDAVKYTVIAAKYAARFGIDQVIAAVSKLRK